MYVWILQIPSWTNLTQRHVWLWVFFTSVNILTMMPWLCRRLYIMIQSIQKHPQMNVFSTYVRLWVFLCGIFSFYFSFVMFWCKLTNWKEDILYESIPLRPSHTIICYEWNRSHWNPFVETLETFLSVNSLSILNPSLFISRVWSRPREMHKLRPGYRQFTIILNTKWVASNRNEMCQRVYFISLFIFCLSFYYFRLPRWPHRGAVRKQEESIE